MRIVISHFARIDFCTCSPYVTNQRMQLMRDNLHTLRIRAMINMQLSLRVVLITLDRASIAYIRISNEAR